MAAPGVEGDSSTTDPLYIRRPRGSRHAMAATESSTKCLHQSGFVSSTAAVSAGCMAAGFVPYHSALCSVTFRCRLPRRQRVFNSASKPSLLYLLLAFANYYRAILHALWTQKTSPRLATSILTCPHWRDQMNNGTDLVPEFAMEDRATWQVKHGGGGGGATYPGGCLGPLPSTSKPCRQQMDSLLAFSDPRQGETCANSRTLYMQLPIGSCKQRR